MARRQKEGEGRGRKRPRAWRTDVQWGPPSENMTRIPLIFECRILWFDDFGALLPMLAPRLGAIHRV